ncbi:unnamed protein product [Nesidiocoris tenuis]|uniref:Uncharacterized protein n=1 Tax=Nesidiocoris tenuis TaxID=355587 RepID=A0A6H5GC77_9HEMI|nr:unnamed protein product [Nesidiocoris tenuis]CAB0000917.1 unnamed protein product [Nesidiocoris tenuis]
MSRERGKSFASSKSNLKNAKPRGTIKRSDATAEEILKPHATWCRPSKKSQAKEKIRTSKGTNETPKPPPPSEASKDCNCQNPYCQCGPCPPAKSATDGRDGAKKLKPTKSTNASILRDASIMLKQEEKHQRRIVELLSATGTYLDYEQYLEELRETQEREALVELEKKRLSGLLSHEEAILARKRVIEANVEKRKAYLEQKSVFERELELFRVRELEKIKESVEEVKEQYEKAKIAQNAVVRAKQKVARALNAELKVENEKRLLERERELERKIAAIREFKVLQQIRKEELNSKDEQMTKLLSVSMEELKARLALYKEQLREELIKNQNTIFEQKCRREMLKDAAANFVREARKCREKWKKDENLEKREKPAVQERVIVDENLNMLRHKLEQARMRRQSFQSKYRKYVL